MFTFVTICPFEDMIYITLLYHGFNCGKIVSLAVSEKNFSVGGINSAENKY